MKWYYKVYCPECEKTVYVLPTVSNEVGECPVCGEEIEFDMRQPSYWKCDSCEEYFEDNDESYFDEKHQEYYCHDCNFPETDEERRYL